ncbi:MAG: hypothetical protein BWY92_00833 [Firmicutes bacterium ADurb.BinA052]|nr:MAG: hypothetical protein BWY92_00833 [Firmicutes bacterium ADurb.BinA052]
MSSLRGNTSRGDTDTVIFRSSSAETPIESRSSSTKNDRLTDEPSVALDGYVMYSLSLAAPTVELKINRSMAACSPGSMTPMPERASRSKSSSLNTHGRLILRGNVPSAIPLRNKTGHSNSAPLVGPTTLTPAGSGRSSGNERRLIAEPKMRANSAQLPSSLASPSPAERAISSRSELNAFHAAHDSTAQSRLSVAMMDPGIPTAASSVPNSHTRSASPPDFPKSPLQASASVSTSASASPHSSVPRRRAFHRPAVSSSPFTPIAPAACAAQAGPRPMYGLASSLTRSNPLWRDAVASARATQSRTSIDDDSRRFLGAAHATPNSSNASRSAGINSAESALAMQISHGLRPSSTISRLTSRATSRASAAGPGAVMIESSGVECDPDASVPATIRPGPPRRPTSTAAGSTIRLTLSTTKSASSHWAQARTTDVAGTRRATADIRAASAGVTLKN